MILTVTAKYVGIRKPLIIDLFSADLDPLSCSFSVSNRNKLAFGSLLLAWKVLYLDFRLNQSYTVPI